MDQGKKARATARENVIQGIPFRYNDPPYMVRGYYRSRVSVRNPKSGKMEMSLGTIEAKSVDTLNDKINRAIRQFPQDHMDMIIRWMKAGDFDPTINNWYSLAKDMILDILVFRSEEECDSVWARLENISNIPISQIRDQKEFVAQISAGIAEAFGKKASSHSVSQEERVAWGVLSAVFETLCAEEIIESNPIKSLARKKSILPTTVSSRALHQRSFGAEELSDYIRLCSEEDNANIRCALILRALLGLTVYELCGLNLSSFNTGSLEIVQAYYQKQKEKPILKERLDSLNSYRRIMCSLFLSQLLSSHKKMRLKEGAESDSPLFVLNGARLEPEALKAYEREILTRVLGDNAIDRQRGDFIRSNAEYYFINVCGFTSAETETLLGRDRLHTYAKNYVDWNNVLVLNHMARKLDRWHSRFLKVSRGTKYSENGLRMIVIKAKPGAHLKLSCEGLFYMSLSCPNEE